MTNEEKIPCDVIHFEEKWNIEIREDMRKQADSIQSPEVEEAQLIRNILDGHTEQFRLLAERYGQSVQRLVGRMISQPEDAEDVTQDILAAAYESLPRFDCRRASFKTWLLHIAYHIAMQHLRKNARLPLVEVEQTRIEALPDHPANILPKENPPDRLQLLWQAVDRLAPEDQMLLSLHYYDGRPLREVAYIVDHTDSYLRSRLQWLRKKIQQTIIELEKYED